MTQRIDAATFAADLLRIARAAQAPLELVENGQILGTFNPSVRVEHPDGTVELWKNGELRLTFSTRARTREEKLASLDSLDEIRARLIADGHDLDAMLASLGMRPDGTAIDDPA